MDFVSDLVIRNDNTMKVHIQIFLWTVSLLLSKYLEVELLFFIVCLILNENVKLFSKVVSLSYIAMRSL